MLNWFKSFRTDKRAEKPIEPVFTDRRRAARASTYADLVAMTDSGRLLKRGIALDLSANGARLRFVNGDSLIDGMTVKIARYGITRRAKMRWRTRTDVGVEFLD